MPQFTVPSLEQFPEFSDLKDKRDSIARAVDEAERRLRHAEKDARASARPSEAGFSRSVSALLGDEIAEVEPQAGLGALRQAVKDAKTALQEIDRRVSAARGDVSAKICAQIKPEYLTVVGKLAEGIITAHKANSAYRAVADELNANEIAWSGPLFPMHPPFLGNPHDPDSVVAKWLREAVKIGAIPESKLPSEFKTHSMKASLS